MYLPLDIRQWVHCSQHGLRESASALLCFHGAWMWNYIVGGIRHSSLPAPLGSWSWAGRLGVSQLSTATAAVAHTFLTSMYSSPFWQWVHSCQHGLQESASALCFQSWPYSDVKLYSWRRRTQWAPCPPRFLMLSSQVRVVCSVHRWNCCL
jgi:hypothetical protein